MVGQTGARGALIARGNTSDVWQWSASTVVDYSTDPKEVELEMIGAVPLRRVGTLAEVAATVVWLLSDESSYLTGQNIVISGGI